MLSDKGDLYGFAMLVGEAEYDGFKGKIFKLDADIEVNPGSACVWAKEAPEYSWIALGSKDLPFKGIFDGQMHRISGLYLKTTGQYAGLFGVVQDATIANLKLTNSYFETTAADAGSIAGKAKGRFESIYSDAIVVSSNARVGGFIGIGDASVTMKECWFDGTVTNTGNTRTAGFIGNMYSGTLEMNACLNTGTIDVSAYTKNNYAMAGGFVGQVGYSKNANGVQVTIEDCLSAGEKVTATTSTVFGAFTGYLYDKATLTLTTSYSDKEACGSMGYYSLSTNTINGYTGNDNKTTVSELLGKVFVAHADMAGDKAKTKLEGFDFSKTWTCVLGGTPVLTKFKDEVLIPDISWLEEGDGSQANPYTISDKNDLFGLAIEAQTNNFADKIIRLEKDIIVNEGTAQDFITNVPKYEWSPIGPSKTNVFAGTFDGNGHTISGLYMNTTSAFAGMFGVIQTKGTTPATVKNLKLTNSYFKSTAADCGSIAGLTTGQFDTVYSDAIVVSSNARVGGFFGMGNTTVSMNKCWYAGTVTNIGTNSTRTAGFIGNMYGGTLAMTNCLNSGIVEVAYNKNNYAMAGGFVGQVGYSGNTTGVVVTIEDCLSVGTKATPADTTVFGAFIGYLYDKATLTITESYADKDKCNSMGYYSLSTNTINGYTGNSNKTTVSTLLGKFFISNDKMLGELGKTNLVGLDFENVWAVVPSKTPILKFFEN